MRKEDGVDAKRPKMLFLCQTLPYPPDGGALIRSYHTMRLLGRQYDITALCFARRSSRPSLSSLAVAREGLGRITSRLEVFRIPQEESRLRFVWDHVRSLVTWRVYTRWVYEARDYRKRVEELIAQEDFSVVHLDSLDLLAYLPLFTGAKVVVAHHNIESQLLARRARSQGFFRRAYIRLQARLSRREEARWCPRVALNVTVSEEDAATLAAIAPKSHIEVAPNGVDTNSFSPLEGVPERQLVFVGGHTWFPNRHGMDYFARNVLPLIHRIEPELPTVWVGRAQGPIRDEMRVLGIHMTGYVDDIRPYVARAACVIVPIYVGGGTRLKILDAWAMGKAVVSTPEGCEGLRAEHGENILIARNDGEFASAVFAILDDPDLRQRLEKRGRTTAARYYDWSVIGTGMLAAYTDACSKNGFERYR